MIVERYTATSECILIDAVQEGTAVLGKPLGTWISVPGADDWPAWCEAESYELQRLSYRHTLELDTSRVLIVDTLEKLDALHAVLHPRRRSRRKIFEIAGLAADWRPVAKVYDGVVIAPYQWRRRCEYMWYYGWDCASGCVWDSRALTHIKTEPR